MTTPEELPSPDDLLSPEELLPDIFEHDEEEDHEEDYLLSPDEGVNVTSPSVTESDEILHTKCSADFPAGVETTATASPQPLAMTSPPLDDDDAYDTDIEIDEESSIIQEKNVLEDDGIGTAEYKRSCTRLNILPETKVVHNLGEKALNVRHQGLGEEGAKALAKSLMKNTKVEQLFLEDNSITPLGVTFISDMLCDNIYITLLDLTDNDVGTYGCLALKEMLLWNTSLTHLTLKNCKIKDSDGALLAEGLQRNERVVYLNISHNELCEEGAMMIGDAIAMNNNIEQLDISWNHIRRKGAVQILKALKRNYCLVKVDLSWNGLGYEGSLSLGNMLKTNKYLRELDVSSNRITWNCATAIAQGLKENDNLEVLQMGHNALTMTGVLEIVSAVNTSRSEVEFIGFDGVPINPKIAYLAETIAKGRDFSISHGGILDTEDVVGLKRIPQDDPLTRLMSFLNDRGVRAVELFKSMEKDRDNLVTREQFITGLKKAQVPLETFEMHQVMEVLDHSEDGKINYRRLNDGMKDQKILLKKKQKRKKAEERRAKDEEMKILNPDMTPTSSIRPITSVTPSLRSSFAVDNGSRRVSRVSLSINQSIQDLRRPSSVNTPLASTSSLTLSRAVTSYRRESRDLQVTSKLGRMSLPTSDSVRSQTAASRRTSMISQ